MDQILIPSHQKELWLKTYTIDSGYDMVQYNSSLFNSIFVTHEEQSNFPLSQWKKLK